MPDLASRTGVDLDGYTPIAPVSGSPVPAQGTSSPNTVEPGLNPFLRCPIPPIWQSSPDSLRQFYQNNVVPQTRLFNPPPNQNVSVAAAAPAASNVTNVTNNTVVSVAAAQNPNLISSDGTTGSRRFFQTANPETTGPTSSYVFQNSNTSPLLVVVSADGGGGGFHGVVYCDITTTPVTKVARLSRVNAGSSNPNYYPGSVMFLVPAGYYYGISVTSGGGTPVGANALDSWTEYTLGS
jgi:hypothetical protein